MVPGFNGLLRVVFLEVFSWSAAPRKLIFFPELRDALKAENRRKDRHDKEAGGSAATSGLGTYSVNFSLFLRQRFANVFHGVFLLVRKCAIPMAAL